MSGSSLEFYGDTADLELLFRAFKAVGHYFYTEALSEINEKNRQYRKPECLASHLVSYQHPQQSSVFMITDTSKEIIFRDIKMKDGPGIKRMASQNFNPDAIEILLGGEAAPRTIVTTTLRTTGETNQAKDTFKAFRKIVANASVKVGPNYRVLPSALKKLQDGWRLTPGIEYSSDLDLKITTV